MDLRKEKVRVCLYSFTVKASSICNDVWDILDGTDQRSSVVIIILGASVKFLHVRFLKCHISPPKTKLQHPTNWRENDIYMSTSKKMIYIDIGY